MVKFCIGSEPIGHSENWRLVAFRRSFFSGIDLLLTAFPSTIEPSFV
ncbi:hypothetical protein EVA_10947 [gut metagenome]|uniref:Uncharacterized protein n=1 Tax=gut metagenome TaxID=749906 RepID=J9GGK1_9ZZZZ